MGMALWVLIWLVYGLAKGVAQGWFFVSVSIHLDADDGGVPVAWMIGNVFYGVSLLLDAIWCWVHMSMYSQFRISFYVAGALVAAHLGLVVAYGLVEWPAALIAVPLVLGYSLLIALVAYKGVRAHRESMMLPVGDGKGEGQGDADDRDQGVVGDRIAREDVDDRRYDDDNEYDLETGPAPPLDRRMGGGGRYRSTPSPPPSPRSSSVERSSSSSSSSSADPRRRGPPTTPVPRPPLRHPSSRPPLRHPSRLPVDSSSESDHYRRDGRRMPPPRRVAEHLSGPPHLPSAPPDRRDRPDPRYDQRHRSRRAPAEAAGSTRRPVRGSGSVSDPTSVPRDRRRPPPSSSHLSDRVSSTTTTTTTSTRPAAPPTQPPPQSLPTSARRPAHRRPRSGRRSSRHRSSGVIPRIIDHGVSEMLDDNF